MSDVLLMERQGQVAILTLNRPDRLNAINIEMLRLLRDALGDISRDQDVRSLVLIGEGRAFSAGADITEIEIEVSII